MPKKSKPNMSTDGFPDVLTDELADVLRGILKEALQPILDSQAIAIKKLKKIRAATR